MTGFTARLPFDATHPVALAVYCSDGRYTHAVEELMRHLGHARLDVLCAPGGPGLLNHRTAGFSDADTFSRAAEFLIREHHLVRVALLAHEGCGYYARRFPDLVAQEVRARQIADLNWAVAELQAVHPRLRAEAYFARATGDAIEFDAITA